MELSQEKGASTWLTALPINDHGFALHKFKDPDQHSKVPFPSATTGSLRMRRPTAAVATNSASNMLCHAQRGYPSIRHNEVRDLTASL